MRKEIIYMILILYLIPFFSSANQNIRSNEIGNDWSTINGDGSMNCQSGCVKDRWDNNNGPIVAAGTDCSSNANHRDWYRAFKRIDISSIPDGARINSAIYNFRLVELCNRCSGGSAQSGSIEIYFANVNDYGSGSPSYSTLYNLPVRYDYGQIGSQTTPLGWKTQNVLNAVQNAYNSGENNIAFRWRSNKESYQNQQTWWGVGAYEEPSFRTYLTVNYCRESGSCLGIPTDLCDGYTCCSNSIMLAESCSTPLAYWADMNNNNISKTDLKDSVKLIYSSTLGGNENVNFEVWKDIPFWFDSKVASSTGAWTNWNATESGTFYFIAEYSGKKIKSSNLIVNSIENDSLVQLEIISPLCGIDMDKGSSIEVSVEALDEDDLITGFIDFGDGQMQAITNGLTSVTHTFNTAGNIQIMANGTNSKGELKRTISNIIIIDTAVNEIYLAACIDEPEDLSHITSNIILFNATSTRGIDFVSATQTKNEIAKTGMMFNWTFSDGNYYAMNGNGSIAYLFNKKYTTSGHNWATLEVELI